VSEDQPRTFEGLDALVEAWSEDRAAARATGVHEEDGPHLLDVIAAGIRRMEFAEAVRELEIAPNVSADDLPGLAEGIMRLVPDSSEDRR
jgi:hypothetical protein